MGDTDEDMLCILKQQLFLKMRNVVNIFFFLKKEPTENEVDSQLLP